MKARTLYIVPIFAALAVSSVAALLLLQILWRPWSSANTSARTDLNLQSVVPAGYTRTPVTWIGVTPPDAAAATVPASLASSGPSPAGGRGLYFEKGCAACHGADARGGAVGPSIAGVDTAAVVKQVRTPRQRMPAFPPSSLSDADLNQIAAYLTSLAPAEGAHGRDLYFAKGCSACHGADARGSSVAPSIAGIAVDTVVAQVHSPQANMPVFKKGSLTHGELEQIATYLSSLPKAADSATAR